MHPNTSFTHGHQKMADKVYYNRTHVKLSRTDAWNWTFKSALLVESIWANSSFIQSRAGTLRASQAVETCNCASKLRRVRNYLSLYAQIIFFRFCWVLWCVSLAQRRFRNTGFDRHCETVPHEVSTRRCCRSISHVIINCEMSDVVIAIISLTA